VRSEQEMYDLILDTAKQDERIRAVILNGSRANPAARRDIFQDFDIQYIVRDIESYRQEPGWIDRFGERMILQMPDDMGDSHRQAGQRFAYLMQFMDGNRIDLTLFPIEALAQLEQDSLSVLLLDKDGILPPFSPASEADYLPKPHGARQFFDCCNEFWWVCPYVAKGIWRGELAYAKYMYELVREQLVKMLAWNIGLKTGFSKNPGKYGKYFRQYLEPERWELFEKTYPDADYANTWQGLFGMGSLFRAAAGEVALHFGYVYPLAEDEKVTAHLKHVKELPKSAGEIY
jgi:aminoglycoside 6-adenylyltransferase